MYRPVLIYLVNPVNPVNFFFLVLDRRSRFRALTRGADFSDEVCLHEQKQVITAAGL